MFAFFFCCFGLDRGTPCSAPDGEEWRDEGPALFVEILAAIVAVGPGAFLLRELNEEMNSSD